MVLIPVEGHDHEEPHHHRVNQSFHLAYGQVGARTYPFSSVRGNVSELSLDAVAIDDNMAWTMRALNDSYTSYSIEAQLLQENNLQTPVQSTPTYLATPSVASSTRSPSSSSSNISLVAALDKSTLSSDEAQYGNGQPAGWETGFKKQDTSLEPSLSRKPSRHGLRLSKPPTSFPLPTPSLPSSPVGSAKSHRTQLWKDVKLVLLLPNELNDPRFRPMLEIQDETRAVLRHVELSHMTAFEQLQRTHFSLFSKRNVLSIRFSESTPPLPNLSTSSPPPSSQPRSSTLRRRTLTVSIPAQKPGTIHIGFKTADQVHHWHALLRFAITPYVLSRDATSRSYRHLRIVVLDAHELNLPPAPKTPTNGRFSQQQSQRDDGSSMRSGDASISGTGLRKKQTKKDGSDLFGRGAKITVEIILDRVVMARTAEAIQGDSPFWGETFDFGGIPKVERCSLHLYKASRLARGQSPSGLVDLTLVDLSEGREQDQRYPIRSYQTGEIIGEMRAAVVWQETIVLPRADSGGLISSLCGSNGHAVIYELASRDEIDCSDGLCRVLHSNGALVSVLSDMCEYEAQGARSTLFRSNTPLTHLLEASMRLFCGDFLARSIGSVIHRILNNRIRCEIDTTKARLGVGKVEGAMRVKEGTNVLLGLAEQCFAGLYAKRDLLPDLLRQVFHALMVAVNKHNPDDTERIRYKAVSSFLFLRLIGPAIMRPYLFGLTSGIPSAHVQRTLNLLAKVMHGLAFFTGRETFREDLLHSFAPFFQAHDESMVDYLKSVATVNEHSATSTAALPLQLPPICFSKWSPLQREAATLSTSVAIDPAADASVLLSSIVNGTFRRESKLRA